MEPMARVDLLPVPPDTIEISMVKIESWVYMGIYDQNFQLLAVQ